MTTVPSIPNTDRIADYTATAGQTDFVIPWVVIADSLAAAVGDFVVDVAGAAIDLSTSSFVGVAITGLSGIWNGGTLTIPACTAGQRVVIYSNRAPRRTSQFLEGKSLPFTTLDQLEDDIAIQMRDLDLRSKRAIMLTPEQYLDGGSEDDMVSEILAASAAATAAAAAAAADLALIQAYGIPFSTFRNVFELLLQSEINTIKAGENSLDITTKIQNAMTANPGVAWFWPAGWYLLSNTITLPSGVDAPLWVGAGRGITHIKLGGTSNTTWGLQQLNPNGTAAVRGFSAFDISFLPSFNGIRLNSITGGFDDTSGTQYYIVDPIIERCDFIFNGVASGCVLLQFNKCFNGGVNKSKFSGGAIQVNFEGSDICWITHNRMDNATDGAVLVNSHDTFGSTTLVDHNDINNPKNFFYWGCDRDAIITHNHMELDFSPGSSGTGGNMVSAINITAGNAFKTTIKDNRLEVDQFCDNWLKYRSANPYSLIAEGNGSTGAGTPAADIGALPYWTNSQTRLVCSHRNNLYLANDSSFPMNYEPGPVVAAGFGSIVRLSASRPGVTFTGIGAGLRCQTGAFRLPADANTGHYLEFSDWASCGFPSNILWGVFSLQVLCYASVAGQILSWQLLDNGVNVASGTITCTSANKFVRQTIPGGPFSISNNLQFRLWNADTGNSGVVFVQFVDIDE